MIIAFRYPRYRAHHDIDSLSPPAACIFLYVRLVDFMYARVYKKKKMMRAPKSNAQREKMQKKKPKKIHTRSRSSGCHRRVQKRRFRCTRPRRSKRFFVLFVIFQRRHELGATFSLPLPPNRRIRDYMHHAVSHHALTLQRHTRRSFDKRSFHDDDATSRPRIPRRRLAY